MHANYQSNVISRILSRSVDRPDGCVVYGGGLKHRYGLVSITTGGVRKVVPAHRAMWMAVHERWDLPFERQVRHRCGNPRCVNIEHLEVGSACVARRRRVVTYQEHKRVRRFSDEQIRMIREEPGLLRQVAQKYGVTAGYVSKLRRGVAKRLVDAPPR